MEHILINELIKLLCKGGGEAFVGNFQKEINEDNQHGKWTENELREAVQYIRYINEFFGRDEAVAIITSLVAKYNINLSDIQFRPKFTNGASSVDASEDSVVGTKF